MQVNYLQHLYNYHFSENHKLWNYYISQITQDQFIQKFPYSLGSVRNHIVHMISVDDTWFCGLRGEEIPHMLNPVHFFKREKIRSHWDKVEDKMHDYLSTLNENQLEDKPLEGEDKDLTVWQVLLHVVNHGTDHRAQVLRLLHDLGVRTGPQDYMFFVYENLQ